MNIHQIDSDRLDYFDAAFESDEFYAEWAEHLDTTSGDDPWADLAPEIHTMLDSIPSEPPF